MKDLSGLSRADRNLVRYALSHMASNTTTEVLTDLGLDEIDPMEHGPDPSESEIDAILADRVEHLETNFRRLENLFEED